MRDDKTTTHFGDQQVSTGEKQVRVRQVFDSVATSYDLMNDLMSLGIHRLRKRQATELAGVRRGQRVLDLAAGTGDLSERFAGIVGPSGEVVVSDISEAMLSRGRDRLTNEGLVGNLHYVLADAEALPVPVISIAPRSASDCATSPTNSTHWRRCSVSFAPAVAR